MGKYLDIIEQAKHEPAERPSTPTDHNVANGLDREPSRATPERRSESAGNYPQNKPSILDQDNQQREPARDEPSGNATKGRDPAPVGATVRPSSATSAQSSPAGPPNSRSPLISEGVRAKIEAIEAEARSKGWPAELLWNNQFWGSPRGLAACLEAEDEIIEVASDFIVIRTGRDVQRFSRRVG
jgi:hypothetical protein